MWEFVRQNPFVAGALSGSLAAYLLGLLVSYWRRDKRWLGFSLTSRNVVQAGPKKLALTYDGKLIQRLDSHTVLFRNIGNRPLGVLPVKVQCTGGGTILEHELSTPDGASFSSTAAADHITINVDLLNPGETFSVGLTVADSSPASGVKAIARAEYLELREIGERANTVDLLQALLPHLFLGNVILDIYKISSRRRR
jgi:hypothetical protein